MRIKELHLTNFQSYTDEVVQFDEGVTVLYGENGAGKSTLLRAIFAGLFQTKSTTELNADVNIAGLVNKNETSGSVKLLFEVDNTEYTLYWSIDIETDSDGTRTGKTDECVLSSPQLSQSVSGVRTVRKTIKDILNMDETAFVNSVYVQQQELMKLLSSSQKERKEIFDNLLGLSKIDTYIDRLHESRREVKSKRKEVTSQQDEVQRQIDEKPAKDVLQSKIEEATKSAEETQETLNDKISEISDLKQKKNTLEASKEDIETLESELESLESEYESLLESESDISSDISNLQEQQSELQSQKETIQQEQNSLIESSKINDISEIESVLSETKNGIERLQEKKSTIQQETARTEQQIDQIEDEIEDLKSTQNELESEKKQIESELQQVKEENQELSTELSELWEAIDTGDKSLQAYIDYLTDSITELNKKQTRLETQKEQLQEELTESKGETYTAQTVSRLWIPSSMNFETQSETTESITEENLPQKTRKLMDGNPEKDKMRKYLTQLESDLESHLSVDEDVLQSELKEIESKLEQVHTDLTECKETRDIATDIRNKEEKQTDLTGSITELRNKYESIEEDIKEIETELAEKQSRKQTLTSQYEDKLNQSDALETQLSELQSKQESAEQLQDLGDKISEISNEIEKLELQKSQKQSELDTISSKIEAIDDEIVEIEDKLASKDSLSDKYTEIVSKLKTARKRKETLEEEYNNLLSTKNSLEEQLNTVESLETRYAELDSKHTRYSELYNEIEAAIDAYTRVKENARQENVALIEYYSNEVFSEIYQNQAYDRIKIDEDYTVTLIRTDNTTVEPELASGGESALINMAIRAGVYRTIAEREGVSTLPPFILDEPTTFLDSGHIDKLDSLIRTMRTWDVPQVFIVSHTERLIDTADTTIHITKENGVSNAKTS